MKILIAYASKTGTTEKCAKILSESLENSDLFDLQNGIPELSSYELVILGGSIRAGMLHKAAKKYIKNNCTLLRTKKVAFFVCSSDAEKGKEFLKANIPAELYEKAICGDTFGGEMEIEKQTGLFKIIAKKVLEASLKKGIQPPHILPDRIHAFAEQIKKA